MSSILSSVVRGCVSSVSKPKISFEIKLNFLDISLVIKKSALKHKLICPWLRPKRLSSDETKSIDVIIHAIKWYEKNYHKINTIILLQPTSPFRKVKDLNNALNIYVKNYKNNKKISFDRNFINEHVKALMF